MNTLIIHHLPETVPPRFHVSRGDQKHSKPVELVSPLVYPVAGRPDSGLLLEMPWYMEEFLEYPYPPNTARAEAVVDSLRSWGRDTFDALFADRVAIEAFNKATSQGYDNLQLVITGDDPAVLQWPWEAMRDSQGPHLSIEGRIERRLNRVGDPVAIPANLPKDRVNVLLVTARPYENDVAYRSISRRLVELIEKEDLPASVHVLRPPTLEALRRHLAHRPHFYHVIHFDGHGGYGPQPPGGQNSVLVFENERGGPDKVGADQLAGLLREHAVGAMVLNACRSAMLDDTAQDPFASVATALVRAGIWGVVAMAYSIHVSAAQEFLPDFYRELFQTGDVSAATRAGRRQLFAQRDRVCSRGKFELEDFVVPVVYRHFEDPPHRLPFTRSGQELQPPEKPGLPEEARDRANPFGFVGRDRELLKLERAIRQETPAVLIHGLGGVGKTTLARGFVKWLADTDGCQGCLWIGFIEVRSAEYVLNELGEPILGPNFRALPLDQKIGPLAEELRRRRLMIVWDNFEVAAGIPDAGVPANLSGPDRDLLLELLQELRGGQTKVIITSRGPETWLGVQRLKVSIGGLAGEERWEYCQKILDGLGIPVDREDPDLADLIGLLDGHPLAMRVVLPRLEELSAGQIARAIRTNLEDLGPGVDRLYATLRFAVQRLSDELRPLLIPLAFHEHYADAGLLEQMGRGVDGDWSREKIDRFLGALSAAGVLRGIGQDIFELHPALTGFLRFTLLEGTPAEARDAWSRRFVEVMGTLADGLTPRQLHEQRFGFHCHGANFRFALGEAARLEMGIDEAALIRLLGNYALNTRNFSEADGLFRRLAEAARALGHQELEAGAYHQLGRVAEEQRDFAAAEGWYRKSLAISEKQGNEHGAAITYHQLGRVAEEQRDFAAAEGWYRKSLAISEKQGNEHGAANTYHQLGVVAEEQRDFAAAEGWYRKSLDIEKKQGNEDGAAITYHQLGRVAQEQRDFASAERWYRKSLVIFEKQGNEHRAAMTYHQLGRVAQEQRDFAAAEGWYRKSLAIFEKQGNEHGAANTYNQLGVVSQEQRDFAAADGWYRKSLAIKEKLGNEHGAAITYHCLGVVAGLQGAFEESGRWFVKAALIFARTNDPANLQRTANNFMIFLSLAPAEQQATLRALWQDAGLGPLPETEQ